MGSGLVSVGEPEWFVSVDLTEIVLLSRAAVVRVPGWFGFILGWFGFILVLFLVLMVWFQF